MKRLGADVLAPGDAAGRIRHTSPAYYGRRCSAVAAWFAVLDKRDPLSISSVIRALRIKPLLVDVHGKPVRPDGAVLRIADVPPLPTRLQRCEVRVPPFANGEQLLRRLGVQELDLRAAVRLVLDAVGRRFGRNRQEGDAVLAFLQAAWRRDRAFVEGEPRIKSVPVPARKISGDTVEWIFGRDAYFSSAWTGNDNLERVYGPFKESKFLAVQPKKRGARQQREFFSALGVAELPILRPYYADWPVYGLHNLSGTWAWRHTIDPNDNGACPDHPRSQSVRFVVVDRLDDILGSDELSIRRATALATLLATMKVPFGGAATVTCANTTHRRRITRKILGYQEWLLQAGDWIPARDPASRVISLRRPVAAWRDVGRDFASLALPRAALPHAVSEALLLPSPANPTIEALEYLLTELHQAHPDLSQSEQAPRDTARWAQQQLDRLLRRAIPRKLSFHLVAEVDGALVWTTEPLVPDVPGASSIPGLPIALGRCANLQRVFGLRTTREVLTISVQPSGQVRSAPYFDGNIKAAILAFLEARGADRDQVATRLAWLRDRPVQRLTIRINYGKRAILVDRAAYIEVVRDRRGAIRGGTLHWALRQKINTLSLAEELAFYLGNPEQAEPLALFLSNAEHVLDRYQITDQDLNLAQSALKAAARRTKSTDDDQEVLPDDDEIAPEAVGDEDETRAEVPPAPAEPQPSTTASPSGDVEAAHGTNTSEIRRALHQFERGSTPSPAAQPADGDGYASLWRGAQLSFGPAARPHHLDSATQRRIRSEAADETGGRRPGTGGGGFSEV